jgi:hypothetical protein
MWGLRAQIKELRAALEAIAAYSQPGKATEQQLAFIHKTARKALDNSS